MNDLIPMRGEIVSADGADTRYMDIRDNTNHWKSRVIMCAYTQLLLMLITV